MTFADLLVTGATWALVLGTTWALVVLTAAVIELVSDGRLALTTRLGCPPPAKRALLAGLGVVLASGSAVAAGPVSAAPAPVEPTRGRGIGAASGLPVPARPTGSAYAVPRQRVEVHPGDSLWRLVRARSSTRASDPEIARLVERTYRANRRVIGPDPDLIKPGQRLHVPSRSRQTPPPQETP